MPSPCCRITAAIGLPDGFARRIARNTQLVLLEESNLAKVADPAAGSGGFEELTDAALRRRVDAVPGDRNRPAAPRAALEAGSIQAKVAAVRAERESRDRAPQGRADRHQRFSPIAETEATGMPRRRAEGRRPPDRSPRLRLAEPFEALRDAADRARRKRARGRKYFWPISARRPISPRARPTPRISSRPAASRR